MYGRLAEWLGSGLQNRLRRFESATDLNQSLGTQCRGFFVLIRTRLAGVKDKNKKDPGDAKRTQGLVDGSPRTGSPEVIRREII